MSNLLDKTMAVIKSCRTMGQHRVAAEYTLLALPKLNAYGSGLVLNTLKSEHKILSERRVREAINERKRLESYND